MNEQNPAQAQNHSLSFTKLTAMIIGSTIGGGIFTTAGDMAASGIDEIMSVVKSHKAVGRQDEMVR